MPEEINIATHIGTLVIGGSVVVAGRLVYDGIKNRRNGNGKYISRNQHDRECTLKLRPIEVNLSKIEKTQTKISEKIDEIHQIMPKRNGDK